MAPELDTLMSTQNIEGIHHRGCCKLTPGGGDFQRCIQDGCSKLSVYNWISDIPMESGISEVIEIRFKNTRKGFYYNVNQLVLQHGDIVAVEATPGHDIGVVSLTGELVQHQMKKYKVTTPIQELKKIYRKAKPSDIEKWMEAIALEESTMLKARKIAENLQLDMKIGDVEYQGDKTKAIFYYIADDRVDFRELIKILADEFKIRVEMRQIGARQEAGRIGGIGPCGRELCCTTWLTNFVSVTTSAARYQEVSLNPQKLAGQCGKLKCCLNYELDVYLDARHDFPDTSEPLRFEEGLARLQKTDVFRRIMWYSLNEEETSLIPLPVEKVQELTELNRKGITPKIQTTGYEQAPVSRPTENGFTDVISSQSVTRFDKPKNKRKKGRRRPNNSNNQANSPTDESSSD